MAQNDHGFSAGEKHKLCQGYLLKNPGVLLEALFNGHHGEYEARVWREYPTTVFVQKEQSPKVDIVAEITGRDYMEIVLVEIKGNTDDTRRDLALESLRRYKRQIDEDNGNPFLKSAPITRGLAIQGYEMGDGGEPTFRITPVSF